MRRILEEDETETMEVLPKEDNSVSIVQLPSVCKKHNKEAVELRLMARIDAQSECLSSNDRKEDTTSQNSKKVMFMILITFLFFFVELFVGFINRSIALLADSYHMLSDVMALTIALVCLRISRRKSKKNGFGWVRAEVLGALVNGVFLLAMCFTISLESIGRLLHPRRISHPLHVLIVGCIGLLINFVGIGMLHGGHGHSHGGHGHSHRSKPSKRCLESGIILCARSTMNKQYFKIEYDGVFKEVTGYNEHQERLTSVDGDDNDDDEESSAMRSRPGRSLSHISQDCSHNHLALKLVNLDENTEIEEFTDSEEARRKQKQIDVGNLNMRGVFLHILSDAIGSVFVIITASLTYFLPNAIGKLNEYLDPALSLTLVCLICFSAYALVSETAAIILRRHPVFLDLDEVKGDILKISGVVAVNDICAWTLVANRHLATAEVRWNSVLQVYMIWQHQKLEKFFIDMGFTLSLYNPFFRIRACFPIQYLNPSKLKLLKTILLYFYMALVNVVQCDVDVEVSQESDIAALTAESDESQLVDGGSFHDLPPELQCHILREVPTNTFMQLHKY
uniref:Zinc transporter n=1 Tax=Heterorhabditis bacteriophora TaxID=37862 RepID=A0A1I7XQ84_HETBA